MNGTGTQIYFNTDAGILEAECVTDLSEIGGAYAAEDNTGVLDFADEHERGLYSAGTLQLTVIQKNDTLYHELKNIYSADGKVSVAVGLSDNNIPPSLSNGVMTFGNSRSGFFMDCIILSKPLSIEAYLDNRIGLQLQINGRIRDEQKAIASVPWDNNTPWDEGVLWI